MKFLMEAIFSPASLLFSFVLPSLTYICFIGRETITHMNEARTSLNSCFWGEDPKGYVSLCFPFVPVTPSSFVNYKMTASLDHYSGSKCCKDGFWNVGWEKITKLSFEIHE